MSVKQNEITCRQVAELGTDLLEGVAGREVLASVRAHLKACVNCRVFIDQLQLTVEMAEAVQPPMPTEHRLTELSRLLCPIEKLASMCSWLDGDRARQYVEDLLPDAEQIAVFTHLVEGCKRCAQVCRDSLYPEFSRVQTIRRELRERIPESSEEKKYRMLVASLHATGQAKLPSGVDVEHFVLWLIRQARRELTVVPAEASSLADLALEIGSDLGVETQARLAMLKGHVTRKVQADYREADQWFRRAETLLSGGDAVSQLLRAKLMRVMAHARFSQSLPSEALALFRGAEEIYLDLDEVSRFGECLIDKSAVTGEVSGASNAARLCLAGSTLVSWGSFPRFGMAVSQNLALYYSDAGRCGRALLALDLARERLRLLGYAPVDELQVEWTAGRILNADGRFDEAAEVLGRVRSEFIALGLASKTAWVSLDLAISLAELGRFERLQEVAEPLIAYFVSRRLPVEALAAIRLFRDTVVSRTIAAVQVRSLAALLSLSGESAEGG